MRERRIKPRYCDRIWTLYLSEAFPERKRQGDSLRNAIALLAKMLPRELELLTGAFAAPALKKGVAN
jgi:hypothetical protein